MAAPVFPTHMLLGIMASTHPHRELESISPPLNLFGPSDCFDQPTTVEVMLCQFQG